jgi:HSP20 family protein
MDFVVVRAKSPDASQIVTHSNKKIRLRAHANYMGELWWVVASSIGRPLRGVNDDPMTGTIAMNLKSLLPFGSRSSIAERTDRSPLALLQREIDELFTNFERGWTATVGTRLTPRMDVIEHDDRIELTAELPGLEEKDVEVTLVGDVLTLRGEKKLEKEEMEDERRVVERSYGSFSRSIQLPAGVKPEDIQASLAKGVLTITVPIPPQAKSDARRIAVKTAG